MSRQATGRGRGRGGSCDERRSAEAKQPRLASMRPRRGRRDSGIWSASWCSLTGRGCLSAAEWMASTSAAEPCLQGLLPERVAQPSVHDLMVEDDEMEQGIHRNSQEFQGMLKDS